MFDIFLEYFRKLFKSRLFPIALIYLALFFVVINRLFVLQIIEGPTIEEENNTKYTKTREIKSTRANIYDCNGVLLASNQLTYAVTIEDSTEITSNEVRNAVIFKLVNLIEQNGDTLDNEFYIRQTEDGEFEFTVDGTTLTRFLKNAYAYVLDEDTGELKEEQKNATAKEVYEFLCNGTGTDYTHMFSISEDYTVDETLKIMGVRYALFCNYPKYLKITVASNISDKTVAAVKENSANMPGVEIEQQTHRVYEDSKYFSHILGYTGLISSEELETYADSDNEYNSTDYIGKTGLEKAYESTLSGVKGVETVSVTTAGKVVSIVDRTDPVAGDDLYLTINSELQKSVYHLLEKEITSILLSKLRPDLDYGTKGDSASDILVPIYEVYNALISNNIIDISQFTDKDASDLEVSVYKKYKSALNNAFEELDTLLSPDNTITNAKAGDEMEDYLDYFYKALKTNNVLLTKSIPADDAKYLDYKDGNISLSEFLQYAIANNWIDLSKLEVGDKYYSAEELYSQLITYTKKILKEDSIFNKMIYRNLVFSYKLSGTEICLLLFDQGVLQSNDDEINRLSNNNYSAYQFIVDKLTSLQITPDMLALEPCSGSVVITDVNTGDILALVSYPSYDNNRLANKVDSAYYSQLLNDNSLPLRNRAVLQRSAPGSTFKMVTAFAALEENVVSVDETVLDLGEFTKITPYAKCHIFPGSHGSVDIVKALEVSCNYYFYEMGWRLSLDSSGKFDKSLGLSRIEKYATLFGLNETSGIELTEAEPEISVDDPVRSAIGQGTNDYTPVQLARYVTTIANRGICYNLTLVDKIEQTDGKKIENSATVNHDLTDFSASSWDAVSKGMYSVVNEPSGSVYTVFNDLDLVVAGKTGTSQISKVNANNALFVSYAPFDNPEISITTVIP
ncbi:MAG: penicillin-binding transpeptidase domain-containing protein, partial [Mobilitalea sp.]